MSKTLPISAPGEVKYFKASLGFPANSAGEFYIEAIGSNDGYGLLDPWWNSGWNYRLPEFNAAVALAQLERLDELVDLRIKSAELFLEAMKDCHYLKPQRVPQGDVNAYYTLGVLYAGPVTWEAFRKKYIELGGDGFYGACSIPYLEPVMTERKFVKRYPEIYERVQYGLGLCPTAESIQPRLMQFKTNYRDLHLAKLKAEALRKTIEYYDAR